MPEETIPGALDGSKRFLLDVAPNGFRAYVLDAEKGWDLFAASSSMSTFLRLMSDVIKFGTGQNVEFQIKS